MERVCGLVAGKSGAHPLLRTLVNRCRDDDLALCRQLLGQPPTTEPAVDPPEQRPLLSASFCNERRSLGAFGRRSREARAGAPVACGLPPGSQRRRPALPPDRWFPTSEGAGAARSRVTPSSGCLSGPLTAAAVPSPNTLPRIDIVNFVQQSRPAKILIFAGGGLPSVPVAVVVKSLQVRSQRTTPRLKRTPELSSAVACGWRGFESRRRPSGGATPPEKGARSIAPSMVL